MPPINGPQLIVGLLLCGFGWTLYWIGLRAAGLGLGALCGAVLALAVAGAGDWMAAALAFVAVGAVVGGVLGLFLIKRAHALMFFLAGALAGVAAARLSYPAVADWPVFARTPVLAQTAYYLVWCAGAGVLLAALSRHVIIIASALIGSILVVLSVEADISAYLFLPLLVVSLAAQFGLIRRLAAAEDVRRHERRAAEREDEDA